MKSIFIFYALFLFLQACKSTQGSHAAEYNTRLGLAYLSQGEFAIAKVKLLKAYNQQPRSPQVNSALGFYLDKSGEFSLADKYYRRAINYSHNRSVDFHNYAVFLCGQKNYQKANRYFMLAVNDVHYADTAKAYTNAGFCNLSANRTNKAAFLFQQALLRDPSQGDSLLALVKIYLRDNNLKRTCNLLHQYKLAVSRDVNLTELARKFCKAKLIN